jgi:erythromycin esterase-like protein
MKISLSKIIERDFSPELAVLSEIDALADGASVIGLGEGIHGCGTFHRANYNLTKYLIMNHGARLVLLESPSIGIDLLQPYLDGENIDPIPMLDGCFKTWRSTEFLDFLAWLRHFNSRSAKERIQLRGFDLQNPALEIDLLRTGNLLPSRFVEFLNMGGISELQKISSADIQKIQKKILTGHLCISTELIDAFRGAKDSFNENDSDQDDSSEFLFKKIFNWLLMMSSYASDSSSAIAIRDRFMADAIKRTIRYEEKKAVVIAHTGHLVFHPENLLPATDYQGKGKLMGNFLKEHFQSAYRVIGLLARELEVWDISNTQKRKLVFSKGFEEKLFRSNASISFIKTSDLGKEVIEIGSPESWEDPEDEEGSKMIGIMKDQLDAFIYFPKGDPFEPI